MLYREELDIAEDKFNKEKAVEARDRLRKENMMAQNAEKFISQGKRDDLKQREDMKIRRSEALKEAQRNREIAKSYLNDTLRKMKDKAKIQSELSRSKYNHRMNTILELKTDIEYTRENLRAQRARDQAALADKDAAMNAERNRMQQDGLNADAILLTNQRRREFQMEEKKAKVEQRHREVEILSKIVQEEENMEKRKTKQPWVFHPDVRGGISGADMNAAAVASKDLASPKHAKHQSLYGKNILAGELRTPLSSSRYGENGKGLFDSMNLGNRRTYSALTSETGLSGQGMAAFIEDQSQIPEDEADWHQIEDMNKPSFPGLWGGYDEGVNVDGEKYTLNYSTKMEKDMMFNALEKQRAGIVQKQIAARREFKGVAFNAKPDIVHFKDLEVGKTYRKKIKLTNVSYTINYLKLVGLSEHLKDFVTLEFESPGQMSAGMTCEIIVTFSPMINENIEGVINFLSQTGPFDLPVKCSVKKCELTLDVDSVHFGTEVIGENLKRSFTLINKGALPTEFLFQRKPLLKRQTNTASSANEYSSLVSGMEGESERPTADETGGPVPVLENIGSKPGSREREKRDSTDENPTSSFRDMNQDKTTNESPKATGNTQKPSPVAGRNFESEDELAKIDGMKAGALRSGHIGPFQEIKLEILYDPLIPGESIVEFEVSFTDPGSHPLYITAYGNAIDVPVWVERQTVPLNICMYNRLFQDSILVYNRASTALALKFEVDKRMKHHLELLPKTAYIQAQSSFSAQLKFLPRDNLAEEAGELFDKYTGILEVPCQITVADQNEPVNFIVTAVVTPSDFILTPKNIDFGYCSIYENTYVPVTLTNKSILPQPFGFVKLPDYVDVQPNDGFGTLLPEEKVEVHLIFKPSKADVYEFEITCKSGIDRSFKLKCKGVAVHPPLELEYNTINFSATAVGDQNVTGVHLINSHTSRNEFTHPVPRIGRGEVAPVITTSYEFCVPEGAPLEVWPAVGSIEPGSKELVKILFSPKLEAEDIKKEAVRISEKRDRDAAYAEREEKYKEFLSKASEDQDKGKPKKKPATKNSSAGLHDSSGLDDPPPIDSIPLRELQKFKIEDIIPGSENYLAAKGSLLRSFEGAFSSHTILCYVASGKLKNPGELEYSVHNTLYLEVHCPAVRPKVIPISDAGSTTIDFGQIAIGQSLIRPVTLQNITDDDIDAKATPLDPFGPFDLRNALLEIEANATHTLLFNFTPSEAVVYHETIKLTFGEKENLVLTLTGVGVSPDVRLSIEDNFFDCGHVLAGDAVPTIFTIENKSDLQVPFLITQDSNSPAWHENNQKLPYFVKGNALEGLHVGPQNLYGEMVFDCSPWQGVIEPHGTQEVSVMFSPDHPSAHYADIARLSLFNLPFASIQLVGVGCVHTTYVEGSSSLSPAIESAVMQHVVESEEDAAKAAGATFPLLVELKAKRIDGTNKTLPAEVCLMIGSVKTSASAQKKGGEFTFDNIGPIAAKGKLFVSFIILV